MKILNKLTAVLCSSMMFAACSMPCQADIGALTAVKFSLPTVQAAPGQVVQVSIDIKNNNSGISALGMQLTYDAGLIPSYTYDDRAPEFVTGEATDTLSVSCMINSKIRTIAIAAWSESVSKKNGTFVTFPMTVPKDAKNGAKYKLSLEIDECWDQDNKRVKCEVVNGCINVLNPAETTVITQTTKASATTTKTTATTTLTTATTKAAATTSTAASATTLPLTTSTAPDTTLTTSTAAATTTAIEATTTTTETTVTTETTTTAETTTTTETTAETTMTTETTTAAESTTAAETTTTTDTTTTIKSTTTAETTTKIKTTKAPETTTTAADTTTSAKTTAAAETTSKTKTTATTAATSAVQTTTSKTQTTKPETTTGPAPEQMESDFNGDGKMTVADAVLLARFFGEDSGLTQTEISGILNANPDQDHDNLLTILDVIALLKKLVKTG